MKLYISLIWFFLFGFASLIWFTNTQAENLLTKIQASREIDASTSDKIVSVLEAKKDLETFQPNREQLNAIFPKKEALADRLNSVAKKMGVTIILGSAQNPTGLSFPRPGYATVEMVVVAPNMTSLSRFFTEIEGASVVGHVKSATIVGEVNGVKATTIAEVAIQ